MNIKPSFYLSILTPALSIGWLSIQAKPVHAELLLPEMCQMNTCGKTLFLGKTLLEQTASGRLYSVELSDRYVDLETGTYSDFDQPRTDYIYCSTRKPARIFGVPASLMFSDPAPYRASLLNPGRPHNFYTSYPIYWVTCHNFVGPDSEISEARTRSLGYTLNLEEAQISITNPHNILD